MTTEQKLKQLILSEYKSVREFAFQAKMPYSTVASIFTKGIDKTSITTMIKICNKLNISIDELLNGQIVFNDSIPQKQSVEDLVIQFKNQLLNVELTLNNKPMDHATAARIASYLDAIVTAEKSTNG